MEGRGGAGGGAAGGETPAPARPEGRAACTAGHQREQRRGSPAGAAFQGPSANAIGCPFGEAFVQGDTWAEAGTPLTPGKGPKTETFRLSAPE